MRYFTDIYLDIKIIFIKVANLYLESKYTRNKT